MAKRGTEVDVGALSCATNLSTVRFCVEGAKLAAEWERYRRLSVRDLVSVNLIEY